MSEVGQDLLESIEATFERFGWGYERLDSRTFRTGVGTEGGAFPVLLRVTEHWVVATINPFVERPEVGWRKTALRLLAGANHAVNMAKVGLDSDDDAFLTVELPAEGFEESHLYDALAALSHYADQLLLPVLQAIKIDELNG